MFTNHHFVSKEIHKVIIKWSKLKNDFLKTKPMKERRKIKKIRNCCKKQYSPNNLDTTRFADKKSFWKERFPFFFKNV